SPLLPVFFFPSRRRHTSFSRDWSSDVSSSDLFWHLPFHLLPSSSITRHYKIMGQMRSLKPFINFDQSLYIFFPHQPTGKQYIGIVVSRNIAHISPISFFGIEKL